MHTEQDLIYWAGYFDGEGCVGFHVHRKQCPGSGSLRVSVANTYLPGLERLQAEFGGRVYQDKQPRQYPNARSMFRWVVSGTASAAFLRAILPYAHEKRPQIELALSLPAMAPADRVPHIATLKSMKRIDWGTAPVSINP